MTSRMTRTYASGNHVIGYTGHIACEGHRHPTTKEARAHVEAREAALREALTKARTIIEMADVRAEAANGPVLHVRDTMTDREWRKLYCLLSEVPQ